jgi:hypothetical protein
VYTNNLYIIFIDFPSYITSDYLNTSLESYATLIYLNGLEHWQIRYNK